MDRREFLRLSAGGCLTSAISLGWGTGLSTGWGDSDEPLLLAREEISVGAEKPFKALHISDTHFTLADSRENERKRTLAESRFRYFSRAGSFFDKSLAYAKENDDLLFHTGDMIDFVSEANLETAKEKFADPFTFVSAGNHEFSQYVGEAREDAAYKAQSFDRVQAAFPNDLTFASRVVYGVNFVAFDNVHYYVTEEQFDRFRQEVEKGLPIIALCHIPFYTEEIYNDAINVKKKEWSGLIGVPHGLSNGLTGVPHSQSKEAWCNPVTMKFVDWLRNQPLLKAILCGHLHYDWVGKFSETATQYVVGGNFQGSAREFLFS